VSEAVQYALDQLRQAHDSHPESLLETWGHPPSGSNHNVYADFIGWDDEFVQKGVPLPHVLPRWRMPIRSRAAYNAAGNLSSLDLRTAEYRPTDWYGVVHINAEMAPGLKIDMMTHSASIQLVRYKRYN
jgi:hypothetical protein